MDESSAPPDASSPPGILLSRDLIFTSKVTGTARLLGRRVLVAGDVSLASAMIAQWQPRVVFVDLAAGDLVQPAALLAFQKLAAPATPFVAFGSHVDTAALAAARAARLRPGPSPQPLLGRASRVDRPLSGLTAYAPGGRDRLDRNSPEGLFAINKKSPPLETRGRGCDDSRVPGTVGEAGALLTATRRRPIGRGRFITIELDARDRRCRHRLNAPIETAAPDARSRRAFSKM